MEIWMWGEKIKLQRKVKRAGKIKGKFQIQLREKHELNLKSKDFHIIKDPSHTLHSEFLHSVSHDRQERATEMCSAHNFCQM